MPDVLWMVLFIGGLVGLWYLAYRIEPHWASRDGARFVCNSQELLAGRPNGRLREAQVAVLPDGTLQVSQKRAMRRAVSTWRLVGRSDGPSPKLYVYLARRVDDGAEQHVELALRIPRKSRSAAVLDAFVPSP
jgi:hypothetical protein